MKTTAAVSLESKIEHLFAAFARKNVSEILSYFDGAAVYHKIPMARFNGHEEIAETLQDFFVEGLTVEFHLQNISSRDNKVLVERITRVIHGDVVRDIPIMGIFEFDCNRRITAWRDYFDRGQAGIA